MNLNSEASAQFDITNATTLKTMAVVISILKLPNQEENPVVGPVLNIPSLTSKIVVEKERTKTRLRAVDPTAASKRLDEIIHQRRTDAIDPLLTSGEVTKILQALNKDDVAAFTKQGCLPTTFKSGRHHIRASSVAAFVAAAFEQGLTSKSVSK
jgi:hypothetical protein